MDVDSRCSVQDEYARDMSVEALEAIGETWEQLAQLDPLWAVLSEPEKQGKKWDVAEFLYTGEIEIVGLLDDLHRLGFTELVSALDFGCGVGRLTLPLSQRFQHVVGIDIAPTMVATARSFAGGNPRIEFIVNQRPNLSVIRDESFDLVYSNIVLQHMSPELARGYLADFYRVVRRGGFVVFQLPSHLTDAWLPDGNDGTRLADGSHRARISVDDAPTRMRCGEEADIALRVQNASRLPWLQDLTNQINVGNHWLDESGDVVVADDARTRLPGAVQSSQECSMVLSVRAPILPGTYVLEFDVVQEGVTWFAERGSPTARIPVEVQRDREPSGSTGGSAADGGATGDVRHYPTFMMRGIAQVEVIDLVKRLGGEVVETTCHETEWVSFRYVTRRHT